MIDTVSSPDKPLRTPNWIIGLSSLLLVGVGGGLYWASSSGQEEDVSRARQVFESRSDVSRESLRNCIRSEGKGLIAGNDKAWTDIASGSRGYNPARHLFVEITETEGQRTVRVSTRDGEALPAPDRAHLQTCLDGTNPLT